ncbi:MAG TPA: DUF721 domain-containing protein [Pyrinomonadaceae bacterium]|nr:DUF721 domain-containing protein [Pyrinomonadaceae bacterium]
MNRAKSQMENVFASVPSIVNGLEGTDETAEAALVFAAWSQCAGEQLRAHAEPIDFSANRLTLAVSDEMWQRHLNGLKPQLIGKMKGAAGSRVVRFLEFHVCPDALRSARRSDATRSTDEPVGRVPPSLEEAAGAIGDKDLRARFMGAAAVCLAKHR